MATDISFLGLSKGKWISKQTNWIFFSCRQTMLTHHQLSPMDCEPNICFAHENIWNVVSSERLYLSNPQSVNNVRRLTLPQGYWIKCMWLVIVPSFRPNVCTRFAFYCNSPHFGASLFYIYLSGIHGSRENLGLYFNCKPNQTFLLQNLKLWPYHTFISIPEIQTL